MQTRSIRLALLWMGLAAQTAAVRAGPPFLTDDPEPVERGHWEIFGFSTGTWVRGDAAGALPGIDVNYGVADDLQAHAAAALAYNSAPGTGTQFGYGDSEIGAKYRFLRAAEKDWWPQMAIYPRLVAPTGAATRGLGTGRTHWFLPVWAQKDLGRWTTYGGGGYGINPGPGNKSYWFLGWVLQRQLSEDLAGGVELFHQTAFSAAAPGSVGFPLGTTDTTGFNLGVTYDWTRHDHLLLSLGRGLQNVSASNRFSYYAAYRWTH